MTSGGDDLLKLLGAGPSAAPQSAARTDRAPTGAGIEHASFEDLLRAAEQGGVQSGLAVEVESGVNIGLTPDQLRRLGAAADRAEASAMQTALVMMDGLMLVMDVGTRRITQQINDSAQVVSGIDGIIRVPADGESAGGDGPHGGLAALSGLPGSSSVKALLAALDQDGSSGSGRNAAA